jgi:mannose-6-phosphate isomerase-like protein (cupin superfamily)
MKKLPHRIIKTEENQEMFENHGWCEATVVEREEGRYVKHIKMEENSSSLEMYHVKTKKTWYILDGTFEYKWVNQSTAEWNSSVVEPGDLIEHETGQIHSIRVISNVGSFLESADGDLNRDTLVLPVIRIGSISATI